MSSEPTHEKQVSTTLPWLWLIAGGAIVVVTGLWAAFAAIYERINSGAGIAMIGIMLFGGLLLLVGIPERRRAEDWKNWQEPARQIAEIHKMVAALMHEIAALRAEAADDRDAADARHEEVMAAIREIKMNQVVMLSRPGAADANAVAELTERCQDLEADLAGFRLWQKQIHEELMARLNGKVTQLRPLPNQQN